MFKSFLVLMLLNISLLFAHEFNNEIFPSHQRHDHLDFNSEYALKQLERPKMLLSTLIKDPQNYQLMLSDNPHFGAEAVPDHVFCEKPTIIIYQGSLSQNVENEELAFVIAHELGHIHHQHMEKFDQRMDQIMQGPFLGISGTTFNIFAQKFEEREADLFGLNLYQKAGYNMNFFSQTYHYLEENNGHDRHMPPDLRLCSSLSMKDSHFSMLDRFQLLANKAKLT